MIDVRHGWKCSDEMQRLWRGEAGAETGDNLDIDDTLAAIAPPLVLPLEGTLYDN